MPLSDFYPQLKGWTPVSETEPAQAPQIADSTTTVNPRLRTSVPLPFQYAPDTLRQYNRPGVSSFRISPMAPSGQPAVTSAAQSVVAQTPPSTTTTTVTDDDELRVYPKTNNNTYYIVQAGADGPGDNNAQLLSFNNNAGGTIVLPGPSTVAGTIGAAFAQTGNGASISISGSDPLPGVALVLASGSSFNTSTFGTWGPATWTTLDPGVGLNLNLIAAPYTSGTFTATASYTAGTFWTAGMLFFEQLSAVPSVVQKAAVSTPITTNGPFTLTFTNPVTKGNIILVSMAANDASSGATLSVSDNTGDVFYTSAGVYATGDGPHSCAGPPFPCGVTTYFAGSSIAKLAAAANVAGGSPTITIAALGMSPDCLSCPNPNLGGSIIAYELSAVGTTLTNGFPRGWYCYIENIGSGTYHVVSRAQIDGVSNPSVALGANQGLIVAFDGTNWFTDRGIAGSGGGGGSFYQTVEAAGTAKPQEAVLNFLSPFGVADNAGNTSTDISLSLFYQTVQQAGSSKPQEAKLNFLAPMTATDNAGNTSTDIATPVFGAAGGSHSTGLVPDPGATPGTTLYLREDGSWANPGGGGTGVGVDNITHGNVTWWADPAFIFLRDDFHAPVAMGSNSAPFQGGIGVGIGQLGWAMYGPSAGSAQSVAMHNQAFPAMGCIAWDNVATANDFGGLILNDNVSTAGPGSTNSTSGHAENAWPLLESSGWAMSWVFKFDNPTGTGNPPSVPNTYSMAKKSFYCGFTGAAVGCFGTGTTSPRPDVFLGLRYDTSATPNGAQALTGTTGAPVSGQTTYNLSASTPSAANGGWIGLSFVIAGFTNAGNNGTFTCTASSTTQVIVANSGGVSETHAGTATTTSYPNDTNFQFEVVMNQQWGTGFRHNAQGTVVNTGVAPTQSQWYRLDMSCTTQGTIVMGLATGSSYVTHTFASIPTMTLHTLSGTCSSNGAGFSGIATSPGTGSTYASAQNFAAFPFAAGSSITVSGYTGTEAALNGTWIVQGMTSRSGVWFNISTNATFTTVSQDGQLVGYPALTPIFIYGSDDSASLVESARAWVDFFSFVWNPNLGSGGTPNVNKARYW